MDLHSADAIVSRLLLSMDRHCERVAVAGSVRRRVPEVKDIEVVAIPRRRALFNMPDATAQENLLHGWALTSGIRWIKPGTSEIVDWPLKRDGKYWRGLLPDGIKLDLFLCTPENWGIVFLIRTGSAAFTKELVTHGQQIGKRALGGFLRRGTSEESPIIPTPEERDVFCELSLAWVAPPMRVDGRALRSLSA